MLKRTLADTAAVMLLTLGLHWSISQAALGQEESDGGFRAQLNQVRAARGLGAIEYDPSLVGTAQANNRDQHRWGLGHYVTGGFAQVAAIGYGTAQSVLVAWNNSPGHAALIYSPLAVSIGYANDGWAATASIRMGVQRTTQPGAPSTEQTKLGCVAATPCHPGASPTCYVNRMSVGLGGRGLLRRLFCR